LPDGRKIPYFWQSAAVISYVMNGTSASAQAAKAVVDKWLTAIKEAPREQLAGIILDNRANGGGCQDDLDYLVGSFINERTEVLKTRYKEGPGRLEYSPWVSYYIDPKPDYHRDITAENIPFVVLTNICSISMGEIEPAVMRHVMPTVHVIGERTYGATGPLQPVSFIDLNYGGPFGDQNNMNHYIYTSTFEAQVGGKVLEGIGVTPDEIVLFKDHNTSFMPQFDAAIEYIKNYK
jgi:C-terminal processing protease CtpA/Prc